MKKRLLLSIIFLIFTQTACLVSTHTERGNGRVTRIEREITPFAEIHLVGSATVILEQGTNYQLHIETDENIQDLITTNISGKELKISNEKSISPTKLIVYIMTPSIEKLRVVGSGTLYSKYPIRTKTLTLNVTGSGDIKLDDVVIENIFSEVVGSGDIECFGSALNAELIVKGSGDIRKRNFLTKFCNATVSGSGDIRINVSDELYAKVSGSGDITYWGNPHKVVEQISGSCSISRGR